MSGKEAPEIGFKADVTYENTDKINKEPDCIKALAKPDSSRKPLDNEQLKLAKKDLVHKEYLELKYPRTRSIRDDPQLSGQNIAVYSFFPSKGAKPDSDGCYGVIKFRGNFRNVDDADDWAEHLLRNHDSLAEYSFVRVGQDIPLMKDNSIYCEETREIDTQQQVQKTTKEYYKEQRDKEKMQKQEIEQKQKMLLNPSTADQQALQDDIDFYITLRNKEASARKLLDDCKKAMEQAQTVLDKTIPEMKTIEETHPDWIEEAVKRYENAVACTGADPRKNDVLPYMKGSMEYRQKL